MQDHPVLEFSGPATIRQAADAHARLMAAVAGDGPVVLDVSQAAPADVSFVQLVESARRTLAEAGRDLTLTAPADGALRDVLDRGGFLAGDDDARRQFWIQNGAPQ